MENKSITLPTDVVSPTDVARLTRELDNLDEFFRQATIRESGAPQNAPRYSRLLDSVVVTNGLNLLQADHRTMLINEMRNMSKVAPVLHISFSVDPPGPYVQKIVTWLRTNIQGDILVRVGLQPNIGAGCVVRSTNTSFDFSLRRFFDSKREFFANKLHEVVSAESQVIDDAFEQENLALESSQNSVETQQVENNVQPQEQPQEKLQQQPQEPQVKVESPVDSDKPVVAPQPQVIPVVQTSGDPV